ncbi:hypothetical protein J4H86_14830 [Spiractinospora alimapuensis]|uniref:hypothetical protein n=1 Tax=Spiractinospora alimapuensis TaxID=2820884 RepID=UPI001F466809|nr:hypothetical protein [Spiractinospora alimapuensis]QVQ50224.1 hypothetical protein J4H86_14830 [Spiractinospora alimapuensis]
MTNARANGPDGLVLWAVGAAAWTALYVASKVVYALEGRLGVTGGPEVPVSRYADYDPGGVAAAQWANAAVGVLIVLLFALCALPLARRLPRWLLAPPVALVTLFAAAGGVGMLGRALITDSGGTVFGLYCLVWTSLSVGVLVSVWRVRTPAPVRGS